jgi:hypothetical protein
MTSHDRCSVYDFRGVPTQSFRRFEFKGSYRYVPEFHVFCRHTEYHLSHLLHGNAGILGSTDVCLYSPSADVCDPCLPHVVIKTLDSWDSDCEPRNLSLIQTVNLTHNFFVEAHMLFTTPHMHTRAMSPTYYSAMAMMPYEMCLHDLHLKTYEDKLFIYRRVVEQVLKLWQVAGCAFLDIKQSNILVQACPYEKYRVILCDHGAFEQSGSFDGSATYPSTANPNGLDVHATEENVCWGLGVLLVLTFQPMYERSFRYDQKASKDKPAAVEKAVLKLKRSVTCARSHFGTFHPEELRVLLDVCWQPALTGNPVTIREVLQVC